MKHLLTLLACIFWVLCPGVIYALEWVVENESRACEFSALGDCQATTANFSALTPTCTHIAAKFHRDVNEMDSVAANKTAAGDLYQCSQAVTDPAEFPGLCRKVRSYATGGKAVETTHGFWGTSKGFFFEFKPTTVPGGGVAKLTVHCMRSSGAGASGSILVNEIMHVPVSPQFLAGEEYRIEANPNRVGIIINVPFDSLGAAGWGSEEGGLGGGNICSTTFAQLRVQPGSQAFLSEEDGVAGATCIGATITGTVVRAFEIIRLPENLR